MHQSEAIPERMPPARYRASSIGHTYTPGDLVTFNGHTGKVSGHTSDGKAVVTFGMNKRREIAESELAPFVPWYSERD